MKQKLKGLRDNACGAQMMQAIADCTCKDESSPSLIGYVICNVSNPATNPSILFPSTDPEMGMTSEVTTRHRSVRSSSNRIRVQGTCSS